MTPGSGWKELLTCPGCPWSPLSPLSGLLGLPIIKEVRVSNFESPKVPTNQNSNILSDSIFLELGIEKCFNVQTYLKNLEVSQLGQGKVAT